ncbi:TolC family protein [Marinoscillum pacificum]|uniref:TolC family protein n=1 Tax=Marinoscillum pacificum TaxID=392723 RepID=UPI002158590D|nr:TolC family protein [Marinoscillum pacificum]
MKNIVLLLLTIVTCRLSAQDVTSGLVQEESIYQQEILKVSHVINNPELLDSLVQKAYRNSATIKTFDESMELYDEEYLQKKRNWVSSFRLGVNLFSANTSLDQDDQSYTTYGLLPNVGLNLTIDPAQLVNRKSMMRQAENKKSRTFYQQEDQKQMLKVRILNLYYEYLAMLESVLIRQHSLDARKQYLRVFEIDFKNGNRTLDELLVIQHQVYLAEESLMKGHVQSMKMKSEIEILLGER